MATPKKLPVNIISIVVPRVKKKKIDMSSSLLFQFTAKYSYQVGSIEAGILQMFMILITLLYD